MKVKIAVSNDNINIIPKYYKVIESKKLKISYLLILGIRYYIIKERKK